jgi:hypothetical protein
MSTSSLDRIHRRTLRDTGKNVAKIERRLRRD